MLRIIKVGGSLFDLPDLADRLERMLRSHEPACNVLLPGGGALADCIREYDATFRFDEGFSHQVAVETMRLMATMLAAITGMPLVNDLADTLATHRSTAGADARCTNVVLDVKQTLADTEPTHPGHPLVARWSVTSDSIAARMAVIFDADELWLLKSVPPPSNDLHILVEEGIVDLEFPNYARGVAWKVIDLRSGGDAEG